MTKDDEINHQGKTCFSHTLPLIPVMSAGVGERLKGGIHEPEL